MTPYDEALAQRDVIRRLDDRGLTSELRVIPGGSRATSLAEVAEGAGLRRVEMLAWRDLDDLEAGGSELHAAEIASRWAEAGIEVTMRTSAVDGGAAHIERDGYRVVRRGGRHLVFPRVATRGVVGAIGRADGLVEIWNGMPFFSPSWARCPHIVFLHHVHAEMWRMTLRPTVLARIGETIEARVAPPLYRRTPIVTLSSSSRDEIVEQLGLPADRVHVVPPGVEQRFRPGNSRATFPLVVAVGRLVPVKRFDLLIDALAEVHAEHPHLRAVIAGEGNERPLLEARIDHHGAGDWIELPGRVSDAELLSLYQQAWVVASASQREGWGMTLTEAGACGTPAVASRIAGHSDAVADGHSGLLFDDRAGLVDQLRRIVADGSLRARLGRGAQVLASHRSWDGAALATLQVLADERLARGRGSPSRQAPTLRTP
jgi:glycosyltransferase involved in cell wall biosynthesis